MFHSCKLISNKVIKIIWHHRWSVRLKGNIYLNFFTDFIHFISFHCSFIIHFIYRPKVFLVYFSSYTQSKHKQGCEQVNLFGSSRSDSIILKLFKIIKIYKLIAMTPQNFSSFPIYHIHFFFTQLHNYSFHFLKKKYSEKYSKNCHRECNEN